MDSSSTERAVLTSSPGSPRGPIGPVSPGGPLSPCTQIIKSHCCGIWHLTPEEPVLTSGPGGPYGPTICVPYRNTTVYYVESILKPLILSTIIYVKPEQNGVLLTQ